MKIALLFCFVLSISFLGKTQNPEKKITLPLPTNAQLRWQNYEQTMFVALDPCTWQGREYDNHTASLKRINPVDLNTDQWCMVAKSWGAKLILFVAKHTGGFCWWQTNTSEYGIKNTLWKNGKGDVLKELSRSCEKYGLDFGIYVYPGNEQWGAGIGSGGKTKDPSKQEEYNKIFRQQMLEVLTRYGTIREVWFDGSCIIPVEDIVKKYAPDAVVFQGMFASLRWVGNEDGHAPVPNWYTLKSKDLKTGTATAEQSDVNGDVYAPVEVDVPLLKNKGHKWFWAPNTDSLILTQQQLMKLYYESVGRGAVLLLNSTPDTSGLIPASHVKAYKEFGNEIKRRFANPLKKTKGVGNSLEIAFIKPTEINHVILQEDIAKGQRVLAYSIEGLNEQNQLEKIYEGTSIGQKRICYFNAVTVKKIKVTFTNTKAEPQINNFSVNNIKGVNLQPESWDGLGGIWNSHTRSNCSTQNEEPCIEIGKWDDNTYNNAAWEETSFDLTKYVTKIGQYEIKFTATDNTESGLEFRDWELDIYGGKTKKEIELLHGTSTFRLTRSQQTLDEFPTILKLKIKSKLPHSTGNVTIKRLIY